MAFDSRDDQGIFFYLLHVLAEFVASSQSSLMSIELQESEEVGS